MAGFLYFSPGQATLGKTHVEGLGLGELYGTQSLGGTRECARGPDHSKGMTFCFRPASAQGEAPRVGYFPDDGQTWAKRKCPKTDGHDSGVLWMGHWNDKPPTPDDLMRAPVDSMLYPGHVLKLGGHEWIVPPVRAAGGQCGLPSTLTVDDDGKVGTTVKPENAQLWEDVKKVWDWFTADEIYREGVENKTARPEDQPPDALPLQWQFDLAVRLLSINYTLGPHEVGALGLLDNSTVWAVLMVGCDYPRLLRMKTAMFDKDDKKKEASPVNA